MTLSVSVEFHHFHGALAAAIKIFAVTHFASFAESAFFHHATGGGIIDEKVASKNINVFFVETIVYHQLQCISTNSFVPVRLCNPITGFGLVLADVDVAFAFEQVADAADGFSRLFQLYGPHVITAKNCADDLQAFFYALVRFPTGARSDIWVTCIFEQSLGITFAPRAQ